MIEPTEREKKLVNYVLFLISMLNCYTVFIAGLYTNLNGLEHWLKPLQEKETEQELIEFLNTEFGAKLELKKDKDYLKERIGK